jgi:hypothetical protein
MYTGGDRDVGNWFHVAGHLAEWNITHYSLHWPKTWSHGGRTYNDWQRFTLTETVNYNGTDPGATDGGAAPGYAQLGTVHFPPNGTFDYDWDNATPVDSYAADWTQYTQWFTPGYTPLAPTPVNNATWGMRRPPDDDFGATHRGFLYWWFSHFPASDGQHGIVPNNWWPLVWDANRPVSLPEVTTPSLRGSGATARGVEPTWVCRDGKTYPVVDGRVQFKK